MTINGLVVTGDRRARTIFPRPGLSGPAQKILDESWYSNERHVIVFEQQKDSDGEVFTIVMSKFDGSEPPASLFRVPHGYHVLKPEPRGRSVAPAVNQPNYDASVGPPPSSW